MTLNASQLSAQVSAKLITCLFPDNGTDKILMQKLRNEKNIIRTSSVACKGISIRQGVNSNYDELPKPTLIRMVKIVVSENEADELFDYIYETIGIGEPLGGSLYMGPITNATIFELPEDIPDEAEI